MGGTKCTVSKDKLALIIFLSATAAEKAQVKLDG